MKASIRILMALAAGIFANTAIAQEYPNKTVRIVVGFAAGGGTDIQARVLGQKLSEYWGQPVVVENRAGAGGVLGADAVAKAQPDGYTILLGSINQNAIAPSVIAKMPYNVSQDFAPVVNLSFSPLVLNVNPSSPAHSIREFTALAKAQPDSVTIASGGNGTTQHLAVAMFMAATGTKVVHVPYKGSGPAVADLLGGQVSAAFDVVPPNMPYLRNGKLRALAVTTLQRSHQLPDVPTMDESGLKGFEIINWYGIFAPAATPPSIVAKLNADFNRALRDPEIARRFDDIGLQLVGGSSESFNRYVKSEIAKYEKIVRLAGIKPD